MRIPQMFVELESHKIYVTFPRVCYLIIHIGYHISVSGGT